MKTENGFENGTVIDGRFRVEAGSYSAGATAAVYKVYDAAERELRAMKYPRGDYISDAHNLEIFRREAQLWTSLPVHPRLVRYFFVREISGVPAVFSEWLEGGSLALSIKSGRLYEGAEGERLAGIIRIAMCAAEGLAYVHSLSAPLIHKDIKPDNIMLDAEGNGKLSDFGLAEAYSEGFTAAYRSPEQARGKKLTAATDIYSLGVTILEMLTGGRCWEDGIHAGRYFDVIIPRAKTEVPEGLEALIRDMLRTVPSERPSAEETLTELGALYRYAPNNR